MPRLHISLNIFVGSHAQYSCDTPFELLSQMPQPLLVHMRDASPALCQGSLCHNLVEYSNPHLTDSAAHNNVRDPICQLQSSGSIATL